MNFQWNKFEKPGAPNVPAHGKTIAREQNFLHSNWRKLARIPIRANLRDLPRANIAQFGPCKFAQFDPREFTEML